MAIVNINVYNDADFSRTFIWETIDGAPIDMTGGSLEMMLRRHADDVEAEMRLATDSGEIVLTSPAAGTFTIRIAQIALERLGLGSFAHSNIFTLNGNKIRIWSGSFTNNAGPTR